jgi:antitoxin component YwqK of YwqJK toxin-antitoxin module
MRQVGNYLLVATVAVLLPWESVTAEGASVRCRTALPQCPEESSIGAYAVDGGFNVRCETSDHVANGPMAVCDAAGNLLAIITLKGGVKDGLFTMYYPSGGKKAEREFANDQPDGWTTEYYESGRISGRVYYRKGEKDGQQTDYLESGGKRAVAEYRHGVQDRRATAFYADGRKESEGEFKNGKPDGEWKHWAEDGSLKSVVVFREGREVKNQSAE